MTISVRIPGTPAANDWQIWVYPKEPAPSPPADVLVSRAWDRPEGRQLLRSIYEYLGSERFRPTRDLPAALLERLFTPPPTPPGLDKAVLRVKAAARVSPEKPEPWRPEADEVLARQDGFGYTVQGRKLATLEKYARDGVWKEIAIPAGDSAAGVLELTGHAIRGNVVITEIVLVP